MSEYDWWPHIERLLIFGSVIGVGLGLYIYYKYRDRTLELRFITRSDFRRVEAKLDTVLSLAAFNIVDKRLASPNGKPKTGLDTR